MSATAAPAALAPAAARGRARLAMGLLLALLALWAIGPLVLMIAHSLSAGVALTGADGPVAPDVLQYLAWVRDAGSHGLASDLFDLAPQTHVWLHPMFSLSGLAVWLGAGVIAAYLAWTPVAIAALFAAALLWARRLVEPGAARLAAVALAVFLNNPLRALVDANASGLSRFKIQLVQATSEPFVAALLWGYLPTVIAVALVPLCLLAASRALATQSGRPAAGALTRATLAAGFAAWLHPWQGAVLILILAGAWAWRHERRELWLALPAVAAVAPLAYYAALGHYDAAWHYSQTATSHFAHFSAGVLLLALGPFVVFAALGVRRGYDSLLERSLVLWVPAALVAYFIVPYASHALEGISFPLAVLIVRAWTLRVRPRVSGAAPLVGVVAALAIAAVTLPGMAVDARDFRNLAHGSGELFYLRSDERRALHWVASRAPAGGVVAPLPFATSIPSQTGRAVWVGHSYWTPDFLRRATAVQALFAGALPAPAARALVRAVHGHGAGVLVSDCAHRPDLTGPLGSQVRAIRRFGCATVYVLS